MKFCINKSFVNFFATCDILTIPELKTWYFYFQYYETNCDILEPTPFLDNIAF